MEADKIIKTCIAVVGLLVAVAGALYALDHTYCRQEVFAGFSQQYYYDRSQDQLDRVTNRIWETEDQLRKHPGDEHLMRRLRELQMEREQILRRIEDLKIRGGS